MRPRVAIYARYSSDLQSECSIIDQISACEDYAEAQGWEVVQSYSDAAVSGAQRDRPDYQRLLAKLKLNHFEIVLTESLDRLSRDQEDLHHFYKRLEYHGIKLYTCADGLNSTIHVGLKGIIAAQYLEDLAQKTRRGLAGRVRLGKSAGGRCFGYDVVRDFRDDGSFTTGERVINPYEAEIVLRICQDYANGFSSKAIAKQLNRESVPSPRGGVWNASTIVGNPKRGNGILNNELYIGRLVWNRQRFKKDPDTRKRVAMPNPEDAWLSQEVPDLRILPDELWQRVKRVQKQKRHFAAQFSNKRPQHYTGHPFHLLSGLLHCRVCGGAYVGTGGDRWRCGNNVLRGTCSNSRSYRRADLESPIYEALKGVFYGPLIIGLFKKKLAEQKCAPAGPAFALATDQELKLRDIQNRKRNLVAAIEAGQGIEALVERLKELEVEERKFLRHGAKASPPATTPRNGAAEALFEELLADLPQILSRRPFAHPAKLALRAALTNRQDWWEHGK